MSVRAAALLVLAGLLPWLAACTVTSIPVSHLQLHAGDVPAPGRDVPVIVIQHVTLPDYLLRSELLIRINETTLRYDPHLRWAEPLDLGIQRVLALQLAGRLGSRQVRRFPDVPRTSEDYRLYVDVHEFESTGEAVVLRATGRWEHGAGPATATATAASVEFAERIAVSDRGPAQIAPAMSELLARFSTALAQALQGAAQP